MPPGAKKRKALKKKQQEQEAAGAGTNNQGFNGHDDHGSQDERDSDGNLSSPGSQGNEEFGTIDSSPPPLSGLGKDIVKEKAEDADFTRGQVVKGKDVIEVGRGTDHEENGVDKPPTSCPENFTQTSREADSTSSLEISRALDSVNPVGSSVAMVVMSDKNEQVESSTDSDSLQQKSDENEENLSPGSAEETTKEIKNVKEYEVPESSEEKSLLPSGPPVVRTSWLSCCGLFDVMSGSER